MCNNSLCSYCGIAKDAFKNGEFEEHFQEHLGKQYHCEYYMKTFKTKHKLSEHIRQLHKGHHTCEICSKVLSTMLNIFVVSNKFPLINYLLKILFTERNDPYIYSNLKYSREPI